MSAIRINGIRVGHQMFHLGQTLDTTDSQPREFLYRTLAGEGINLPCLGVEQTTIGRSVSCCTEQAPAVDPVPVCMVSVYPHGAKSQILGCLFSLLGRNSVDFFHMVSSNAMISFIIAQQDKARLLGLLEKAFDLPPTHTPYEPGFHEETAAFVKKRYQETRAYFRETKIKTYGLDLTEKLVLRGARCSLQSLEPAGTAMAGVTSKFYFATAFGQGPKGLTLYRLMDEPSAANEPVPRGADSLDIKADMLYFHGPHFGDRYGIFNEAAACLETEGLELLLAGCTGASVTLVLPLGQGAAAVSALKKGFDTP